MSASKKEVHYIVSIFYKSLDIFPSSIITGDFNEPATGSPRLSAPICKASVRVLGIYERGLQNLAKKKSKYTLPIAPVSEVTL